MRAKLVTGLVRTWSDAERSVERVMSCGYTRDAISLVMSDGERDQRAVGGNAGAAADVGGAAGSASAALAVLGTSVAFPDLGLVAAGPIEAALAGAGAGAGGAAGGLVDALVDAGIPEHRASIYDSGLRQGAILVGVMASSERDVEILELILEYAGAEDVRSESSQRRPYDSFI
ncbi:hypothetical protein [Sorangium atrum]|uniref:General stress protein 17M-like domain-containing protein n=1 Tax=Sorangium atrum TaxID=2995308 RepID=A0ABT5BSX2_9BACT|nr:hypothetical protein [Sorangium aterium]MDC0677259.1 hypothetical protein [Sorangium aterium]